MQGLDILRYILEGSYQVHEILDIWRFADIPLLSLVSLVINFILYKKLHKGNNFFDEEK